MDLVIVAFYTLCDDLLIEHGYQDDPRAKMSAAEVMTTALVAAELFGGNQQQARSQLNSRHASSSKSRDIFPICSVKHDSIEASSNCTDV